MPYPFSFALKPLAAVIALLAITTTHASASTPAQISFQNVMDNRDVTTGEVDAVFQDSQGFMWIGGASGLYRFDAYDLKPINTRLDDGKTIKPIKFTKAIFEDSHQKLWVSTRNGLYRYDPILDRIEALPDDPAQPQKISSANFLKTVELPTGEILGCSLAGLFVIDQQTLKYSVITPGEKKIDWLHGKAVNTALVLPSGDVWLGTDQGLEYLEWRTKSFVLRKPLPDSPDLVAENFVTSIAQAKDGKLWLGTSRGLVLYDTKTLSSKQYLNNPDPASLGGNDIWDLMVDSKGVLWIATDGGGLAVFDPETQAFTNHKFEAGRATSINSDKPRTVYEDKTGDIWAGNFPNGLNFYDRSSAAIQTYARDLTNPNSLSHTAIISVAEANSGNLWVGTDGGGLNYFNRATGEFTAYKNDPNTTNSLGGNSVPSLFVDTAGAVWLGTFGAGLNRFNPQDKTTTRYPFEARTPTEAVSVAKSLNGAAVWSIKPDKDNPAQLWLTSRTGGISRLDTLTGEFTNYFHVDSDPNSIANNSTWITLEDSTGNFWVGTAGGLDRLDKATGKFEHFTGLSNPSAISLLEDSKQRLWVGTDAGLNLLDPATKTFKSFTKADGFIDDTIRRIVEDRNGLIWVSTFNGFASLNPETHKIKTYNRIAGRLTGGFSRSGILTSRGEVIFGGVNGLRIFKPDQLTENAVKPPVAITDFKIFSDSVAIGGDDELLTSAIGATNSITLDYTKSMFTLEFSALNFRDSAKNQFAYKLEGFDKDWINAGTARTAKYTNLSAGTYVFRVSGSNNDGVWNEAGKSLTIVQLPPPWKTWWAYTLYGLMFAGLVAAVIRQQQRKRQIIIEQNKILEIKVAERTAEVVEKGKDIQAMLVNIRQGLFTITSAGLVHNKYSAYLETIFESQDIAGKSVDGLLLSRSDLGSDALDSTRAALFSILGESEFNFECNGYLLPTELTVRIEGHEKILALEWNPIIENEVVNKLMVSVRDVTLVKKMEAEATEQKRQLEIVGQLLGMSAEKFLGFEAAAQAYIAANQQAIENAPPEKDEKTIGLLFRNMHTIKGNSRTFGLSHLSNVVHEVESTYTELKTSAQKPWEPSVLLRDLGKAKTTLAEYSHIYRNVLGRAQNEQQRQAGFWMPNAMMQKILHLVDGGLLTDLKLYVSRINAKPLDECLSDVTASLISIASQLDKKAPNVIIPASNIRIKQNAQQLLRDVFSHILRNSLDHGLETPMERIANGKPEAGTIIITPSVVDDALHIYVSDDGRGLNLRALHGKGVKLGWWEEDAKPSADHMAQLIFESGVSTKATITDVSGRGVGMDAVRQFLMERGGSVGIELDPDASQDVDFIPFALVIVLPNHTFFEAEV